MKKIDIHPDFFPKGVFEKIDADALQYFPSYLRESFSVECGSLKFAWIKLVQSFLESSVKIFLRPRKESAGALDIDEVKRVYDREAGTYDWKHHLTTCGQDMAWRRQAAYCALNFCRGSGRRISLLDICTGTGLTIKEMAALFSNWGMSASLVGFDYNAKMLERARARQISVEGVKVNFLRGDAMNLVRNEKSAATEMSQFDLQSFDVVTQMFGIGGISDPLKVFQGVLQILRPGGHYFLIDMHQPIFNQPGEWSFLLNWFRFPIFEAVIYNKTTMPLVLSRLWGWRDTTLDFYLLPLVTFVGPDDRKWGFKILSFEIGSQRWWFGLPIMPVAKIIVEKTIISEKEYKEKQAVLSVLS